MSDVEKDIKRLYPKIRKAAIDYLTEPLIGISGPVSNKKLREWGYWKYKRAKIGGWM